MPMRATSFAFDVYTRDRFLDELLCHFDLLIEASNLARL